MPQCKACDAEIRFIRTEQGRKMPVDAKPITGITSLGKLSGGKSVQETQSKRRGCLAPSDEFKLFR